MIKRLRVILTGCLVLGMLISFSPTVRADDGCSDNSSATINIGLLSGNRRADISASGPGIVNVRVEGPSKVNIDAGDGDKHDSDTVIDIGVNGDVKVDIDASGPSELNVDAKGPAQVSIDAGDEVKLNVQASEESQVIIKGQNPDEPAGVPEATDDNLYQPGAGQQDTDNDPPGNLGQQTSSLDDYTSRLNPYVVIISAAFPVLGVLTFIIIGLL